MERKLPIYEINIDDNQELGVYAVSLVDTPAIEIDFIKLAKEEESFFLANIDRQMLYGPLLVPGKLIYRRDDKGNEYYITFSEDTIQKIAERFNENKLQDQFNFQHSDRKVNAVLIENWITSEQDKSKELGFSELPTGSWFGGCKVRDERFWKEDVKTNKVNGFSVEIKANVDLVEMAKNEQNINLMEIKTKDGIVYQAEALEIGAIITDADGIAIADGDITLEDGTVLSILDGKIAEISTPEEEVADASEDMEELSGEEVADAQPTIPMDEFNAMIEEIKGALIAINERIDSIEASISEKANAPVAEEMSKIEALEAKIEELSMVAGAKPLKERTREEIDTEKQNEFLMSRIALVRKNS
jgi:hypothetical protein